VISDCVSLSDKLRREERPLVAKEGALDAMLFGLSVVYVLSPNPGSISVPGAKHDALARPDALRALAAVLVVVTGVVPLIECQQRRIAVLR
jgi:hypothetical protein